MIALAAIIVSVSILLSPRVLLNPVFVLQAHFLLSPDRDFSPTGGKSGISYVGSFKAYRDMITAQAGMPRFKRITSSFNMSLFGAKPAAPIQAVHVDQGSYDDEIEEYLHNDPTSPPTEPITATIERPSMPPSANVDEEPPSPHMSHCATASITVQESDIVKNPTLTISVMTPPPEPQAEADAIVAPPKKGRPVVRKKVVTPASDDAIDAETTPVPATRSTRASARQTAPPPTEGSQQTTHSSGRKRTKN